MNERIKELARDCWSTSEYDTSLDPWFNHRKFAELVIQECITNLEVHTTCFDGDVGRGIKTAVRLTKEHFGVEE